MSASRHAACVSLPNLLQCQTAGTVVPVGHPGRRPVRKRRLILATSMPVNTLFCAFCSLVFDHRFCCILAQMNLSTVWYGLQNQAFQGAAYIAAIRRKKQEVFFLFSSPICGPASETQGRLQRRPGNTPHGRTPQPLKTAFQQKSARFVAGGSVLR